MHINVLITFNSYIGMEWFVYAESNSVRAYVFGLIIIECIYSLKVTNRQTNMVIHVYMFIH